MPARADRSHRGTRRGLGAQTVALHTLRFADEDLLAAAQRDATHHAARARATDLDVLEVEAAARALRRRRPLVRSLHDRDARRRGVAMRAARNASAAGPSLVATLIFLWLTRIPRCASSALSTLRTVCFGDTSVVVRMCTSDTSPVGPLTMRTFRTPGSVCNSSSARSIGSSVPAIGEIASIGRGGDTGGALKGFAGTISKAGVRGGGNCLGVLREGTAGTAPPSTPGG